MITNLTIKMTKDQVVDRLKEQLEVAVKWDTTAKKQHEKAERDFLVKFRDACKAASRWTYEEAKQRKFQVLPNMGWRGPGEQPECPQAMTPTFERAISQMSLSNQKDFMINPDGQWAGLHRLLTWDPYATPETDVCS